MKKAKKSVRSRNRKAHTSKKPAISRTKTPAKRTKLSADRARAEGMRLFQLAGRPSKEDFIMVYGERGHLMTWNERAKAGVSASKFQKALAEKRGRS